MSADIGLAVAIDIVEVSLKFAPGLNDIGVYKSVRVECSLVR